MSTARQVARRVFATEFNNATYTFKESDDDRAPVFTLLPTGVPMNRIFISATLIEAEPVNEDAEYWRARITDGSGDSFYTYAGEYQQGVLDVLKEIEPPAYVSLVGKPRHYEGDDGSLYTSVRPEALTIVDDATRRRWLVEAAEQTLSRIEAFRSGGTEYIAMAKEHYGDDIDEYRTAVITALENSEP